MANSLVSRNGGSTTMETWVLIPAELSLVLTSSENEGRSANGARPVPQSARVWTRVPVTQGRRWSPFQGTVRLGVMPSDASFPEGDVSFFLFFISFLI